MATPAPYDEASGDRTDADQPASINGLSAEDLARLRDIYDARRISKGEWMLSIMFVLKGGPLSYSQLLEAVRAVHAHSGWPVPKQVLQDSVLSRTLRIMIQSGLIIRSPAAVRPFTPTEYRLSAPAADLLVSMQSLAQWAQRNARFVRAARASSRANTAET